MTDKSLIPPSPSEDDYVRQVAAAEPPPLLGEDDPFALFDIWLKEAIAKEPNDANAMALACSARPVSRSTPPGRREAVARPACG